MVLLPTAIQCACFVILWIGEINASGDLGQILGANQREFDYFQLALQWPGTFCHRTRHCCPTNGCCRGSNAPAEFTIHGLWPNYNDGSWPSCCTGKKFEEKEISTLLDALNKYWPSLSCRSPSNCHGGKGLFWEHEWEAEMTFLCGVNNSSAGKETNFSSTSLSSEKHGTCSSSVTGAQYNYFVTTLNVYFKYNVTEVLREAGYVASNSEKYPLEGIVTAIQNAFHATPELRCSGDAVQELYLCFYKDFKPRDCATKSKKKSCPRYVSLPEYASLKMANDENEVSESTLDSVI